MKKPQQGKAKRGKATAKKSARVRGQSNGEEWQG